MADYHPLIAQAISRLARNTPALRQALFERARAILDDQLRLRQPPASNSEITRERAALEDAIRKAESDSAKNAVSHSGSGEVFSLGSSQASSPVQSFEQAPIANGPPRGRITILEGQRPIIELGERSDASTFIHLSGHRLLDELIKDAVHPQAPDSLRQDVRTVLKWLGVAEPKAIEAEHHDRFARAFERFVVEGQAPSAAIAPALAALSESITKVYGTPHSLKVTLNEDIRGVFNRMFAMPGQIATWTADRERAAIVPEQSMGPRVVGGHTYNPTSGRQSTERRQPASIPPTTAPTHQIRQSELLYWSETIGCGATMKLRSEEICAVSVARSGVLVKSSRMGKFRRRSVGFFGAVLYNERNVYKAAQTALALNDLFPDKGVPVTLSNPVLSAYANAIWQCSTAAEVTITLNESVAKAEAQARADEKIVNDLADMMAQGKTKALAYYDVSALPHPKEMILKAIEREILREPSDARVELLKVAALFLTSFQKGIGSKPLFELGLDLDELSRRAPNPREQLRMIHAESPEVERVRYFQSLNKIDTDRTVARLEAAVQSRAARLSAAFGNSR